MTSNPPPDYAIWGLILSTVALVVSVFSVIAQYIGVFRKKLEVPLNENVMIYQTNGDIVGGVVTKVNRESITMKKVYHVDEDWLVGTMEPMYTPKKHIANADIPVSSVLRWKKFPADLRKQWEELPE